MNWLQRIKIAENKDKCTFLLLNGQLHFFRELHSVWLAKKLKMSSQYADLLRFVIPRGRADHVHEWPHNTKLMIEASAELAQYKEKIAQELELNPIDRPVWSFGDEHYKVWSKEKLTQQLAIVCEDGIDEHSINVIERFVPGIREEVLRFIPLNQPQQSLEEPGIMDKRNIPTWVLDQMQAQG